MEDRRRGFRCADRMQSCVKRSKNGSCNRLHGKEKAMPAPTPFAWSYLTTCYYDMQDVVRWIYLLRG
jgi:hypothetical protein